MVALYNQSCTNGVLNFGCNGVGSYRVPDGINDFSNGNGIPHCRSGDAHIGGDVATIQKMASYMKASLIEGRAFLASFLAFTRKHVASLVCRGRHAYNSLGALMHFYLDVQMCHLLDPLMHHSCNY